MSGWVRSLFVGSLTWSALTVAPAYCQEYTAEPIEAFAPADGLDPAIAEQLAPTGVKIVRDGSRVVCEIWLLKSWELASFSPEGDLLYPFTPGQLIGLVRLPRKTGDFRDQGVAKGLYTLRYALQPVDGAHVGTSPTRDFLLMANAEIDTSPEVKDIEALTKASAEAAGTAHPTLLALKVAAPDVQTLRHDETNDWWLLQLTGKGRVDAEEREMKLELVVVGHAAE